MTWGVACQRRSLARMSGRLRMLSLGAIAAAAAVILLAAAGPVSAQVVACVPPNAPNTCTVSNTESTFFTDVTLPGVTVVAPNQPVLSSLLQAALAGPNGAAIQTALVNLGVLGPVTAATLVGTRFDGTSIDVTPSTTFGPATLLIGNNQSETFFVVSGTSNLNTHTHVSHFFSRLFQASRPLSSQGINFLLGDLHTTFQTTLIDGAFQFMRALLWRGSEDGVANGLPGSPFAFAPEAMGIEPFDDALAFATKAPRVPMTVAMANGWRAWIRGTYGRAEFDGSDANFGFRNRTASGEGGIERVVGQWMYGAAFGFGHAKVTQDVTGDNGKLDTVRAGAYAGYRPGPWWVTAAVAVGFSNIDSTRLAALPVQARSEYDATTFSAGIEAVKRIQTAHVTIEPLAGLVYTGLRVDAFAETGTTFLDLAGSRANIDALKGYVGGRVYKTIVAANGWAWTPEARGRVLYDFLDDPRGYTARFIADPAGTPIPVTGLQPDRFAVMLGAAVTTRVTATWRTFASYDAELRGGDVLHLVSGGVKGNW